MIARAALAASFAWILALPGLGLAAPSEPAADPPASPAAARTIVVRAAELHLGDGQVHAPGALLIEGGRIKALGSSVDAPEGAEIWDEPTLILTPWLVDPSVRVALGSGEGGKVEAALLDAADMRPLWDPLLADSREQGLFAFELVPDGGSEILGRSAVIGTEGPGPAGAPVLVADAHLVLATPATTSSTASAAARQTLADTLDTTERYSKKRAEWKKESKETGHSDAARNARADVGQRTASSKPSDEPALDPAREIIARVNEKKLALRIRADRAADVSALLALAQKRGLTLVLSSCRECGAIAQQVADSQASIILEPARESAARLLGLPVDPDLAASLAKAGARLAVSAGGEWPAGPAWLRVMAADLAGRGVPRAIAIAAMSGEAARAAGLPDPILATGQPARFLLWDGDPLSPSAQPIRRIVPTDVGFDPKDAKPKDAKPKDDEPSKPRGGLGR